MTAAKLHRVPPLFRALFSLVALLLVTPALFTPGVHLPHSTPPKAELEGEEEDESESEWLRASSGSAAEGCGPPDPEIETSALVEERLAALRWPALAVGSVRDAQPIASRRALDPYGPRGPPA